MLSGESFVIQYDNKIYKLPIYEKESKKLMHLYYMYKDMDQIELPSKFIFPEDMIRRADHFFSYFLHVRTIQSTKLKQRGLYAV